MTAGVNGLLPAAGGINNMRRMMRIHIGSLVLSVLDLAAMMMAGISFRGQWLDILLSVAPLLTALYILFRWYRSLKPGARAYFITFSILNLLASPIYLLGTICFAQDTEAAMGHYEARQRPGVLSPPAVIVLKKHLIFEQVIRGNTDYDFESGRPIRFELRGDNVGLILPKWEGSDTVIYFK